MKRILRRWMILGLALALLAGACSDADEQATAEGGLPVEVPAPVVPEVPAPVAAADPSPPVSTDPSPPVSTDPSPPVSADPSPPVSAPSGREAPEFFTISAVGEAGSEQVTDRTANTARTVRLSEGNEGDESDGVGSPTVSGDEGVLLGDEEIRAVLDRLPPWDGADSGATDFNRPAQSLPPPRTGRTVDQPFPAGPDVAAPAVDPGPLEVLRVQPEGEVGIAPFVGITFNQPMVPLATIGQLDDLDVPARITPSLPGRWQWIGTRTLRFEHDPEIFDRLPMATSYTVEIPAGTESQSGGELAETFRFEFETPPPTLTRLIPNYGAVELRPVFLAVFDQRVEPSAVLEAITLESDGREYRLRLAYPAEIEADEDVSYYATEALEGTWVAFRPLLPLKPDSPVKVTVGPHVPSVEGPNTGGDSSTTEVRTYAPLRVEYTNCSRWECSPGDGLEVYFNNPLDVASVEDAELSVSPEIPDATVSTYDGSSSIRISGPTEGGTVYKVVIPPTVGDVFGQTLGDHRTVEFEIQEAEPLIWSFGQGFDTVDPLGVRQTVPVIVRQWEQLRVRLYAVDPGDFDSYLDFASSADYPWSILEELNAPWPLASDRTIRTGARDGALTEVPIDLSGALNGRHGHLVMVVEGAGRLAETADPYPSYSRVITWIQDTNIGIDLVEDGLEVVLWTTDLRSGEPLAGVEIQLGDRTPPLVSDADGLARAATGAYGIDGIVASLGTDRALGPVRVWESLEDRTIWYTADDRGMYRPGETLQLKGWVRHLDLTADGGLEFLPTGTLITYTATGPFGNDLGSGVVRTDEHGGFDLALALSEGANLGWGRIEFRRPGAGDDEWHLHSFQVQEFRRPEFEVEARVESAAPHFIDEPAEVAVDARYFSGGALPNAEVTWTVTTRAGSYSPPNWGDFRFGVWRWWWWYYESGSSEVEEFSGTTGADGSHYLRIGIEDDGEHLPVTVTASAEVLDVNRQRWDSSVDFLVHSADLYVGIRSAGAFVKSGDGIDVEAIVTDLDGNPVEGRPFEVTAARIVSKFVDSEWVEVALDIETCRPTSEQTPVACEFTAGTGGRYRIAARIVDDSGRAGRSELTLWVSGAKEGVPSRGVELESVNLVPDLETYAAGDTAEILVGSPFASATGLLTVVHNRIIETRTFEVTDHSAVLRVPITDDHVPGLELRVDLAAVTDRTADDGTVLAGVPPRPAHGSGEILLRVPPVQRTLEVTATPAAAVLQPGARTSVAVEVNDAGGAPVEGASVLLIVVDEAVLALSGYELIDPIDVFYRRRAADLSTWRGRETILLENLEGLQDRLGEDESFDMGDDFGVAEAAAAPAMAFDEGGAAGILVAVRRDLDALALFEPEAVTDAAGRVLVDFELPDNLTRYRVMAVAVHGADRFGTGESAITARLSLQVRPSAPRFLNYGDRFELPVVVQNQTDAAVEADVVVQTSNLEVVGSAGRRVTVPANDRVEVRFPARTVSPGVARFRVAAVSGDHADAQVVSLPVYTPATSEAFATYGVLDEGAVIQPIVTPEDVIPQFGGLEVNTSSTALQALTDAVIYLADYRYASSDAYASRIMAISSLRDVLAAFEAEGLAGPAELDATVRSDIAELSSLQYYDGGFGWWGGDSHPYSSIQAMHALAIASDNGFDAQGVVIWNGLGYLRNIENRIPDYYNRRSRDMLTAYALYVRSLYDEQVATEARALWYLRGAALGLDALARLWPLVDDEGIEAEIERILNNRAVETAGAATFATNYGEDAYLLLHSDRRTDGIVLDALIGMAPRSDLIPKVVAGLLAHRIRGRWSNVQENSFILLALGRYFDTFEATDPDFVARVWLGDLYAAEHEYSGRSTDRGVTLIPMAELLTAGDSDLVVAKDGDGRLYYRLGLRYAPDDLDLEPLDRGFVVQRSYEAVDDPSDVRLDDDGVWHVRAGAEVRVNVTMVNDSRRTNMALIDPLPAGFEPLNPALAVTGHDDIRDDSGWWWWTWYRHQNLRDDRAEAFAMYLWAGTHRYSYVARATTPGTFVVPPARAEEIYAPEVFGRSGTDKVVVADSR